jgi:Tfp pilus tip-associated adhesin PilY1
MSTASVTPMPRHWRLPWVPCRTPDVRAASDAPPPSSCSEWPCVVDSSITGGSSNSLADVAQYYYVTDLRPELTNDVRVKESTGAEGDRATHQHMTTFTLALGVSGTLNYSSTYKSRSRSGTSRGSAAIRLSGGCNNTCTATDPSFPNCTPKSWPVWPDPTLDYSDATRYSDPRSIDDFWHTAVNGRGLYFSADDPNSVVSGLQQALAGIQSRLGAGSAAATSTMSPVAGDNAAYRASYVSQEWVGDLAAYEINPATGVMSTSTAVAIAALAGCHDRLGLRQAGHLSVPRRCEQQSHCQLHLEHADL